MAEETPLELRPLQVRGGLPALRAWRLYRNMTQIELAERSGIVRQTIIRLESGEGATRRGTVEKLAKALRISRTRLLEEYPQLREARGVA